MSNLLTNPRIFVAMATDGLGPRWLGHVSPRTGTPIRAVLTGGALGIGYVLFQSFEQLTAGFVVGAFPFYILAVAAVFVLRRREPELARPFRVPAYPVVPLAFIAGASLLLVGAAAAVDRTAIFAFAVVAAGLPLRWVFTRSARRQADQG
jgi:APA family basic amino acid/polyamine antiporter